MKDTNIILYTMKGCPFCDQFKKMLKEEKIQFFERDIDEHSEEYNMFSKITDNDMLPAFMVIEGEESDYESFFYAPERDYSELTEAINLINEHRKKVF